MVSNQSGIARGLYDWTGFAAVQAAIASALSKAGARLDAVFACAHHADGKAPLNIADHPWRKPNPGMIVAAAERMKLDLAHSWIAGDRASDLAAGKAAGLAGGILISPRADDAERAAAMQLRSGEFAVDVASSLADAVAASSGTRRLNATIVGDMNVIETAIPGVLIIEPKIFGDARGFFLETFHAKRYADIGIAQPFVQDNLSRSVRGSLRGLHFQHPRAQGKLVTVLRGAVRDVAVDVRVGSPTFGKHVAVDLDDENRRQFFVPRGFAHGFVVRSESADFFYKCDELYSPADEKVLRWNDPALGIDWGVKDLGIKDPILSARDKEGRTLAEVQRAPRRQPREDRERQHGRRDELGPVAPERPSRRRVSAAWPTDPARVRPTDAATARGRAREPGRPGGGRARPTGRRLALDGHRQRLLAPSRRDPLGRGPADAARRRPGARRASSRR